MYLTILLMHLHVKLRGVLTSASLTHPLNTISLRLIVFRTRLRDIAMPRSLMLLEIVIRWKVCLALITKRASICKISTCCQSGTLAYL